MTEDAYTLPSDAAIDRDADDGTPAGRTNARTHPSRARVGQAKWLDYPQLCQIAITDALEERDGADHYPPPAFPDVYLHIMDLIGQQIGWVAKIDEEIVGVVFLVQKHEPHNTKAVFLETAHFWVIERHRTSANLGSALLQIAKQFADQRGQPLKISTNMGKHPKVIDRYMEKHGFTYLGGNFWRDARQNETRRA